MKIEIAQSEAPTEVPDAEMTARVFTALATFFEAHTDDEVPTLLGHIERLRATLYRRLGRPPVDAFEGKRPSLDATRQDRFLRVDEVMDKTALGRTTIWRMERDGDFPPRRQVGANSVAWLESEVERWMAERPIPEAEEE